MLLGVLLVHCLLDFDTQFVSVALLLFLVLDSEPQATRAFQHISFPALSLALLSLVSIWIGTASLSFYLGNSSDAVHLYPGYTTALTDLLPEASEQELEMLADRILRLNSSVALAHDAKAKTEFASGSFSGMLTHKQEAIHLAKYNLMEYLDYFDLLRYSYELYSQRGDMSSAEKCLTLIAEIPQMLETVREQTSRLGWMILEHPELDLPDNYVAWLNAHPIQ